MTPHIVEVPGYTLTDDPSRFELERGHGWISKESYWAPGIPFEVFSRSCANSLTLGVYPTKGPMAAMARMITDQATFGWLADVFVDDAHRGQSLGKAIVAYMQGHPSLQGFRRMHLATRDAHGLYAQFGYVPLTGADRLMEIRGPAYI